MKPPKILILNGSNLNLLGTREPEIYGRETLEGIKQECLKRASELGLEIDFRQTNHEGVLIDWIHEEKDSCLGILINPGAFGRTSLALLDALKAINLPVIEIHMSNIHKKESYRPRSYVSYVAVGMISGFFGHSYLLGLEAMARLVASSVQADQPQEGR